MIDQLIIGDKGSFDDFGASVAKREIGTPKKKSIKETVPFSNITYDFTAINGEIYWEERELQYVFEMTASTPERLETMEAAFANWLMNIIGQELHDPFIPDHHFLVTYDDMEFANNEEMDKATITVNFMAYPYKISNYPKAYEFEVAGNRTENVWVLNESSHRITPKVTADKAITLDLDGISYSMAAGTVEDEAFKLKAGMNAIAIRNSGSGVCNVTISFYEEVF